MLVLLSTIFLLPSRVFETPNLLLPYCVDLKCERVWKGLGLSLGVEVCEKEWFRGITGFLWFNSDLRARNLDFHSTSLL